jgi:hypothetical protein
MRGKSLPEAFGAECRHHPVARVAIAGIAMAVGLLVYVTDRSNMHAWLIPMGPRHSSAPLFGTLGQWLPSFVHPFAFSLLSSAVLPPKSTPAYGACAAWCAVNLLFELGQHRGVSTRVAAALHSGFGSTLAVRSVAGYFTRGTFDVGDVAAVILGSLAAAVALRWLHQGQGVRHAR